VKIKTNAGVLSSLLQIVVRAVSGRSTIQLLSAVLFEAKDGVLKMSATDMEMSISLAAQAPIQEEGRVAIPARVLLDIAKSLPEGELAIEADDKKATLSHGKNSYDLRVYDPKDYPKLPAFPAGEDARFAVPAKPLAGAVRKVLPSVSKDDTRPVLTGVLVSFEGGKERMVSTDSYRLSINEVELGGSPKEPGQAIIPGRALKEVARLSELAETVEVALTENAALFRLKGIVVGTRLIDGSFPEYERLLPGSFAEEFAVDAGVLKDSLKRVNLFAARQHPPDPGEARLLPRGGHALRRGAYDLRAELRNGRGYRADRGGRPRGQELRDHLQPRLPHGWGGNRRRRESGLQAQRTPQASGAARRRGGRRRGRPGRLGTGVLVPPHADEGSGLQGRLRRLTSPSTN
jgi:DNA polymerase-3 subunit beta